MRSEGFMSDRESCGGARWAHEIVSVIKSRGYEVVESGGSGDYNGSGYLLATDEESWIVYTWSYGTCDGCDRWDGANESELEHDVWSEVDAYLDEASARARYVEVKSRDW